MYLHLNHHLISSNITIDNSSYFPEVAEASTEVSLSASSASKVRPAVPETVTVLRLVNVPVERLTAFVPLTFKVSTTAAVNAVAESFVAVVIFNVLTVSTVAPSKSIAPVTLLRVNPNVVAEVATEAVPVPFAKDKVVNAFKSSVPTAVEPKSAVE